jgi:hypothetical protein
MIKITKHPLERRSYMLTADEDKTANREDWKELQSWLNANASGWVLNSGILTLPKELPSIETYFTLRFG